jgi:hypothetical protein
VWLRSVWSTVGPTWCRSGSVSPLAPLGPPSRSSVGDRRTVRGSMRPGGTELGTAAPAEPVPPTPCGAVCAESHLAQRLVLARQRSVAVAGPEAAWRARPSPSVTDRRALVARPRNPRHEPPANVTEGRPVSRPSVVRDQRGITRSRRGAGASRHPGRARAGRRAPGSGASSHRCRPARPRPPRRRPPPAAT